MGHSSARRPRRRGDQDRGPGCRRRRRPLRPALPGGRALALLRDVQPQQEERLAGPAARRRPCGARRPRARLRRRLLEPPRRPTRAAASYVRRPEDGQSADRLLLAQRLRDDGSASFRRWVRLHDARARRLDEPDRRSRRPADEERPLARRPLRRVRLGDRSAGGALAGSPRRRGLRLRRLAVRDRPARAHVRRDLGGLARLRRRLGGATPPIPRSCRSRPFRPPTAGSSSPARSRSSGRRSALPSAGPSWRAIRDSATSPRATATATSWSRSSSRCSANARRRNGSRCFTRPACLPLR